NKVYWAEGDEIALLAEDGSKAKLTLTQGAGSQTGEFGGKIPVGKNWVAAVYPYTQKATYNNEDRMIITRVEYEKEAGDIYALRYKNWTDGTSCKAQMATLINNNDYSDLSFKVAGAVIAVTINNLPAGYDKLEVNTANAILHDTKIYFDDNGVPTSYNTSSDWPYETFVIHFTPENYSTDKTFYIPISLYNENSQLNNNKFTIKLYPTNYDGTEATQSLVKTIYDKKEIKDIKRGTKYYGTYIFDNNGNAPIIGASKVEMEECVKGGETNFVLPDNMPGFKLDVAPGAFTTEEDMSFSITSTASKISTKDWGALTGKVDLYLPETTQELSLYHPSASVELLPKSGSAVYTTVTAHTAENTLIIPAGVEIENLVITRGNIKVYGTVGSIENKTGKKVKIFKGAGAILPEGINDDPNFEIIDLEGVAGSSVIEDVFVNGGTFTLQQDIQLSKPLVLDTDTEVTINLNGYNITAGVFAESNGTISEGTTDSYVFWVKKGTLNIEGKGRVIAQDAKYSIAVWADGGIVNINGTV
ncbi:MAG: hypothetical protein IKT74_02315, partial [Bacteroidales bacterium]|nr:hypothetical protein [Bacteroidales bacterium]